MTISLKESFSTDVSASLSAKVRDLVAIDFTSLSDLGESYVRWKGAMLHNTVIAAEHCARNLWYGRKSAFDDFPDIQANEGPVFYHGHEAYAQVLKFASGLGHSQGEYDPAAKIRFYQGWQKLGARNESASEYYGVLFHSMARDVALIEQKYSELIEPIRPWLVARELGGHKKNGSVFVICDSDASGIRLSEYSIKILLSMNDNGVNKVRDIALFHPDPEFLKNAFEQTKRLFKKNNIDIGVYPITEKEIPLIMDLVDNTYITLPMGSEPQIDNVIIDFWPQRQNKASSLVHMNEGKNGGSDVWKMAGLDNAFLPAEVFSTVQKRKSDFEIAKEHALQEIENLSISRAGWQVSPLHSDECSPSS